MIKNKIYIYFVFLLHFGLLPAVYGQFSEPTSISFDEDEVFDLGGDIFTDFNEDLETSQILEDERYYRYGRFFTFSLGLGVTSFTGNRGSAYENEHPSFALNLIYFLDFQTAFGLGLNYSKHYFIINGPTVGFETPGQNTGDPSRGPGLIEVSMLRPYFQFRYYIDTSDLGTAITYSNPYAAIRMEYWYQTNKFVDQPSLDDESGGGIGIGVGFGLEFPIEIKKSYVNAEFLYHNVNFFDKNTQKYRSTSTSTSKDGYDDLGGDAWSTTVSYVWNW